MTGSLELTHGSRTVPRAKPYLDTGREHTITGKFPFWAMYSNNKNKQRLASSIVFKPGPGVGFRLATYWMTRLALLILQDLPNEEPQFPHKPRYHALYRLLASCGFREQSVRRGSSTRRYSKIWNCWKSLVITSGSNLFIFFSLLSHAAGHPGRLRTCSTPIYRVPQIYCSIHLSG